VPEVGDRLQIITGGMTINPIIIVRPLPHLSIPFFVELLTQSQEHTASKFTWQGNFHGLLKGMHRWEFKESREEGNEGGTTFIQAEDLEGLLSVLFISWLPWWLGGMRGGVERDFGGFNAAFKEWVEGGRERG